MHFGLFNLMTLRDDGGTTAGVLADTMALVELAASVQNGDGRTDIGNIWYKHGDEIIKNASRPVLQDLDPLPILIVRRLEDPE